MAKHPIGYALRYCHEGAERYAQVTDVHPDTGEVTGLAFYDEQHDAAGNVVGRVLVGGNPAPKQATTPEHRITHGHYWK